MKSTMNLWADVKAGKLDVKKALAKLDKVPGGGSDTQTYRRLIRKSKEDK